jgi:glucokinase
VQDQVVEDLAGGPGLAGAYAAATGAPAAGAEEVLAAAARGEPAALRVVEDGARLIGTALGLLVNMVDPEVVIVGGGLGSAEGPLWPAIVAATRAHIFAEDARGLPILRAQLGPDAGLIGAALCAP